MRIGAHESTAGGLLAAFERADAHRCEAMQIWTSNGSRWAATRRDPGEITEFAAEARRRTIPLFAHGSYLVNLAAPSDSLLDKSRRAFLEELDRCEALGVWAVVIHPGAHGGAGAARGVRRVAASVRWALRATRGYRAQVLLELTAGQGTCLGASFAELQAMLQAIDDPARTGVCFDTQHAFAAGYDLRSPAGYEAVWREFDRTIGLERLRAFHLNDSKRPLGSRVDRHEEIGKGFLGALPFRRLVVDPRFRERPAMVELPPTMLPRCLARLRRFRA
jgi:deoxyribonuclease-4